MFSNWMSSLIVQNHMQNLAPSFLLFATPAKVVTITAVSSVWMNFYRICLITLNICWYDMLFLSFRLCRKFLCFFLPIDQANGILVKIGRISLSKHTTVDHFYYIQTIKQALLHSARVQLEKKISYDDVIHTEYYHSVAKFLSLFVCTLSLSKLSIGCIDHLIFDIFTYFCCDFVFFSNANYGFVFVFDRWQNIFEHFLYSVSFKRHTLTHSFNLVWGNWFFGLGLFYNIIIKSMNFAAIILMLVPYQMQHSERREKKICHLLV